MQVVAHLCEGTLGGSRPPGAEDGYWTGQNEIHSPTLQVNAFNCFEKSIVWQKKASLVTNGPKGTGCYREFCNFLATVSNRAHFCFQVSRAHKEHFKVHLLTSFSSLSPLGKFTTSPSTATRRWRHLRSIVERCTPSQPCWWPKIWKSMAKMLLSDLLIHKHCFYAST